jgi:hypothetical protein
MDENSRDLSAVRFAYFLAQREQRRKCAAAGLMLATMYPSREHALRAF